MRYRLISQRESEGPFCKSNDRQKLFEKLFVRTNCRWNLENILWDPDQGVTVQKKSFQKMQNGGNHTETEDQEIQNLRKLEQNLQRTYLKSDPAQGI